MCSLRMEVVDDPPCRANAARLTDSVSSAPCCFATPGTRPYSPGFGRRSSSSRFGGSAMQRQQQPEPSDGRPRVPDARRHTTTNATPSKRGKTRFRDDRSRKYQHHAPNSGRYNVKKYDGMRKESPIKQHPAKSEKVARGVVVTLVDDAAKDAATPSTDEQVAIIESLAKEETPSMSVEVIVNVPPQLQQDSDMKANVGMMENAKDENAISSAPAGHSIEHEQNVEEFYTTLREYLQVEAKFQPRLCLPAKPQRGEISAGTRDGAVHVLRCLKVWYDLPTDVLFHSINLLDRFLTKMKVRLCHISCISVSCMHIAILSHRPQLPPINPEDLVSISQCKCTAGDVRRMSAVIEQKLGAVGETISPIHWLRLLLKLLRWASTNLLGVSLQFFNRLLHESEMINKLEILLCDASCCNVRACELALVLLCTQLDSHLMQSSTDQQHPDVQNVIRVIGFAMELQRICQIGDESFCASHQAVVSVLERYNTRQKTPHRQCLVWKLSSRTLKVLRPTHRLTSTLPTIQEQQYTNTPRSRSASESSEDLNEDMKDWPTSPVVPILCNDN